MRLPLAPEHEDALALMREVLQDAFVSLEATGYRLEESFEGARSTVQLAFVEMPDRRVIELQGHGVGLVDAVFDALMRRFAPEHPSLESLRFSSLSVRGLMEETRKANALDASAQAEVGITNSYGNEFRFGAVTSSLGRSNVEAVLAAVEFFVNSERACVATFKALEHHRKTGRHDLEAHYTGLLARLVRNTSYSRVIDALRR